MGSTMATALRICFVLALMSAWITTRANPSGSLRPDYYIWSCPQAEAIVFAGVQRAVAQEARMAGSLLRLHFHDCFVNVSSSIYIQIFMISVQSYIVFLPGKINYRCPPKFLVSLEHNYNYIELMRVSKTVTIK